MVYEVFVNTVGPLLKGPSEKGIVWNFPKNSFCTRNNTFKTSERVQPLNKRQNYLILILLPNCLLLRLYFVISSMGNTKWYYVALW